MTPRRHFRLPEADEAALDRTGLLWETVIENNVQWVIVHERPVPTGYNHAKANTALMIPPAYADAQIDMVYFTPDLARSDGRPIPALAGHALDGKTWQRWSRHRTEENPWRPGEDDVESHLLLVDYWLRREIGGAR